MNENLIVNALLKTDPALYQQVDGGSDFLSAIKQRGARVEKYRRYERGDHDQNLTKQQRLLLNIQSDDSDLNEASSNYCGIVIDMMAGRTQVSEITSEDETENNWIIDTLGRNRFESKQGEWFRGAIRDCESYVIVDPQTALWSSEPAYDGYSGVVAIYDPMTMLPNWACKLYSTAESADVSSDADDLGDSQTVNIVVYQPDQITYWIGQSGGGEVAPVRIEQPEGVSLPIVESGNGYQWSLGLIPMVQFANKRDNYTPYGESEIRSVIPLQDIVNGTLYDMMMASKLSAFKIYYSIGMEIDKDGIVPGSAISFVLKDANGNAITDFTAEQIEFLKSVKVGEFGVTDMSQYTNQLDKLEREISQVSSTPVYGITAQGNLSGEALKQLESGLIGKVYRFQNENSGAIEMLLRMTAEIQRNFEVNRSFMSRFSTKVMSFLGLQKPTDPPKSLDNISINWQSPEIVNVANQMNALSQLRRDNPGLWPDEWYRERIGGLIGMSSSQIKAEGEKAQLQSAMSFSDLMNANNEPGPIV
jgi:hypothetical protein